MNVDRVKFVRVMACHWLNEEMARPSRRKTTLKTRKQKNNASVPDLVSREAVFTVFR